MCNTSAEAGAAMDAEVRALRAERDALLRVARAIRARHAAVAAFGEWQLGAEGDGDALLRALDATADEEDAALAALDAAGEGE